MQKVLSSFVFISAFFIYVSFRTQILATSAHAAIKIPEYVSAIYADDDSDEQQIYRKIKLTPIVQKNNINTLPVSLQKTIQNNPASIHYKNGTYTGPNVDSYYEMVQIKVVVTNHSISSVTFLPYTQYNNTSKAISDYAMPILKREALTIQSANVNTVSGATEISDAFVTSLTGALQKAS